MWISCFLWDILIFYYYLCTEFDVIYPMSVDFRGLTDDLRMLVACIKERCSIAERKIEQQKQEIAQLNSRIAELEALNEEITSKYQSLQAGMTMSGSAEEVSALKDRYLALVREIDDCIGLMQHGR